MGLRYRTESELNELIALARTYCEVRARQRDARAEGRLSEEEDARVSNDLQKLDLKLELLKNNNELVRSRAHARNNIVQLGNVRKKAAR